MHEPVACGADEHDVVEVPRPSGLHAERVFASRHVAAPGTQTRATHAPAEHDVTIEQGDVVYPPPSALHTRRVEMSAHDDSPGVHTLVMHRSPRQLCPAAQACVVAPEPRASHTLMCVASMQRVELGAHACGPHVVSVRHSSPIAQSASATQSTQ